MKRIPLIIFLAAILLLAMALPAFAGSGGSSGTVYGKAVLAPYAIVVTGGGTDPGVPLTYEGNYGQDVFEKYDSRVTIQNTGTQTGQVLLDVDTLPTNGSDTWNLTSWFGPSAAEWSFQAEGHSRAWALPTSDWHHDMYCTVDESLASGGSESLQSRFKFPSSSGSTSDHYMSATLSIAAPY